MMTRSSTTFMLDYVMMNTNWIAAVDTLEINIIFSTSRVSFADALKVSA